MVTVAAKQMSGFMIVMADPTRTGNGIFETLTSSSPLPRIMRVSIDNNKT